MAEGITNALCSVFYCLPMLFSRAFFMCATYFNNSQPCSWQHVSSWKWYHVQGCKIKCLFRTGGIMRTCWIINRVTHHTPHDLHCLHINLGATLIQHKKNPWIWYTMMRNPKLLIHSQLCQLLHPKHLFFRLMLFINNILDLQNFLWQNALKCFLT
jgi:hypothetical protein